MGKREITVVSPKIEHTDAYKQTRQRRVVAYARVSTNTLEQENSLEAQKGFFAKFIKEHTGWVFSGLYVDEGISGMNRKRREGFNAMMQDADLGKFDLIITKSFSRFARNTVDTLIAIRELKSKNIEVYFQKEDVFTFDAKGEFLITLWSSFAQQESESISENIKWGIRRAYENGRYPKHTTYFLGYDRGADKSTVVINKEEAQIVKFIFYLSLQGYSNYKISHYLSKLKIPTAMKKSKWSISTIDNILHNERSKGDALLQKKYTVDIFSKKEKKNEGELPQYYVEDGHPAIIPRVIFDYVQFFLNEKSKRWDNAFSCKFESYCLITCGSCKSQYGFRVSHSNNKYRSVFWRCNGCYSKNCDNPKIADVELLKFKDKAIENFIYDNQDRLKEIVKEFSCICNEETMMSLLEIIMNRKAMDFSSINVASIMSEIVILENAIDFVFKDGMKIRIRAKRKKGANRLFIKD